MMLRQTLFNAFASEADKYRRLVSAELKDGGVSDPYIEYLPRKKTNNYFRAILHKNI